MTNVSAPQFGASLTDDVISIIYDSNMFIIQDRAVTQFSSCQNFPVRHIDFHQI